MKINLDRHIPAAIKALDRESLEYLKRLFRFNVPMRIGIRKNRKEKHNYKMVLTVTNWGKYGREVKP